MPNLHGMEGVIVVGGLAALFGVLLVLWIRWEDRHTPHPPAKQPPH